jgi:Holliday junction DNA helicase RuvA
MLSFIKGTLVGKAIESPRGAYFLVDLHGMGFEVLSSQRSVESSPMPGEQVQLFTTLIVREDAMFLVGFNSKEERDLFNILQSASGVGVKVALALLSSLSVSEIAQAVISNNHSILTKAKGVGTKLAQKMVLELKEKMMSWRSVEFAGASRTLEATGPKNEGFLEAEAVLLSLGYQPDEIARSFQSVEGDLRESSSEVILRESLRWLAQSV